MTRRYWCWCEDECPHCSDDYLDVIEHGEADACDETAERWVNPPAPVEGVGV